MARRPTSLPLAGLLALALALAGCGSRSTASTTSTTGRSNTTRTQTTTAAKRKRPATASGRRRGARLPVHRAGASRPRPIAVVKPVHRIPPPSGGAAVAEKAGRTKAQLRALPVP